MTRQRLFRFGVGAARFKSVQAWIEYARKVEEYGYATLTMPDHFGDQLAPMPALMLAAAVTSTLHIGTFVLNNDYRHPVLLAKETATLDVLSSGRLELGLGAGWMRSEYEKAGIQFDSAGIRISRFEEAVHVIKGLFSEGPFTHSGNHYTVTKLDGQPKPVQRPWPPLLIGGGSKRVLALAAREADIVSFGPRTLPDGKLDNADMTMAAIAQKVDWVRQFAGERFESLELNVIIFSAVVTDNRQGAIERVVVDIPNFVEKDALDSPHLLIGSVESIIEKLHILRECYGLSYIKVPAQNMMAFAPVVSRLVGK